MNTNLITRKRPSLAILTLVAALSRIGAAQTPIVFVHGLNSDGTTWGSTPSVIEGQFFVTPLQPSLSSFHFFQDQAVELRQKIGAQPSSLIAVGHSNGGIVLRLANFEQPMQGIVTIGTPHRGAQLATRVMDGSTYLYLLNWGNAVIQAPIVYIGYEINDICGIICGPIYNAVVNVVNASIDALYRIGFLIPNVAGPVARATTVLGQMEPTSPVFDGVLNSGFNLYREDVALRARTAIVSEAWYGYTSMFVGLTPGHEWQNTLWQVFLMAVYDANYQHYVDYADYGDPNMWEKRLNAYLWAIGYNALAEMDYQWCQNQIGGWDFNANVCRSDGIVPSLSQAWPGARRYRVAGGGPGHMRETDDWRIQDQLAQALAQDGFFFEAPPEPPPPPPPPPDDGGGDPVYSRTAPVPPTGRLCHTAIASKADAPTDRASRTERDLIKTEVRGSGRAVQAIGAKAVVCSY
jgi:pimeloyl-ACP methyl ester carboxylesterase